MSRASIPQPHTLAFSRLRAAERVWRSVQNSPFGRATGREWSRILSMSHDGWGRGSSSRDQRAPLPHPIQRAISPWNALSPCDATGNWHLQPEVRGRGKKIPCFSQEDGRESQSIFFLSILPPQYIKDLSVSVSFIHDHFNLSCHHLFPGLFQLSPHQSPCLYSSSYIQIPFPSDFFFDHESFRRVLTFPRTWKIGRFFPPIILFSHFIALYWENMGCLVLEC